MMRTAAKFHHVYSAFNVTARKWIEDRKRAWSVGDLKIRDNVTLTFRDHLVPVGCSDFFKSLPLFFLLSFVPFSCLLIHSANICNYFVPDTILGAGIIAGIKIDRSF